MDKALGAFIWLKQNLAQPSTMASISSICTIFGLHVDAGMIQNFLVIGTLFFGTMGFFLQPAKPLARVD